ncbi:MAG TPA: carboxypeptidase regulatory-like domain-containing protein [Xanthobacteraceae bacterium]|nr:carboxypeptidase regulatory-like domain-containing protein [Xanthobacteraceae bacterium]
MRIRSALLASAAASAALVLLAGPTMAQSAVALTGKVSSAAEPVMEGVVISAKKDGSTITISVISNDKGQYSFPADRLEPGHYTLSARAVGYDLDGPNAADVTAGKATTADIALKPTRDLSRQLTNAEWMMSMPGTNEQKSFLLNCNSCHTIERIVRSTHNAEEFEQTFTRMGGYYPGSTPMKPQRLLGDTLRAVGHSDKSAAEYLASINLSQHDTWPYQLKTLPRLTGKSTHVIITEYDLPNPRIEPHDVMLDREGMVWYSDFGQMFLGKMDPKTGKVTQYPIPETKKGSPVGTLNLEFDNKDNPWIGLMYQGAIAEFDRQTETFRTWSTPKEWDTNADQLGHLALTGTPVDNKVWIKNSDGGNIYRLDLTDNKFENLGAFKDPRTGKRIGTYGLHSDSKNNIYLLDFAAGNIVKIDAKTELPTVYLTPTPNSRPRRGRVDAQDRLWFAEYEGNAIGMFDPKTEKITEWKVPTPWSAPYDAEAGRNGEAWTGSMLTDRVARLDIKSGQYTEYQLPHSTNIRRVFVDDSKSPGTLWVGNNHGASIVKVEPLD